jgi:hypothetical protein
LPTAKELIEAVEGFLRARKSIHGADEPYTWGPGYSQFERKTSFPIEINGELPRPARLEIIGFPSATFLKFRLVLCYNCAVCRLDYTDETHANTRATRADAIEPSVTGPHFHSWELNRRFLKGASTAFELHNAEPFSMTASFDSILRWFCQKTNIDSLGGNHLIELPRRDTLL